MKERRQRGILEMANSIGLLLGFTGMIISVVIQVFARFLLESAPPWTEETARIFFIFSVAFGAGLGVRHGAYIYLDSLIHWFPPELKRRVLTGGKVLVVVLAAIITIYSVEFIRIGSTETSPALGINMGHVFFSMFILGSMLLVFGLLDLVRTLRRRA